MAGGEDPGCDHGCTAGVGEGQGAAKRQLVQRAMTVPGAGDIRHTLRQIQPLDRAKAKDARPVAQQTGAAARIQHGPGSPRRMACQKGQTVGRVTITRRGHFW